MSHRYLVVQMRKIVDDGPVNYDEWVQPTPVACQDSRAVHAAIAAVRDEEGADWRLYEWVSGQYVPRAATFKTDGTQSYDVEIT